MSANEERQEAQSATFNRIDEVDTVPAYGGLLEVHCHRRNGAWEMVAVWAGYEHTLFEASGGIQ
jgi:hypothetical protein